MLNTPEQLAQFAQANVEAMLKSGQSLAAGLQELGTHLAREAQASLEETTANLRALTAAKSLHEAVELQSQFVRTRLERAVSEGGKLTERSLRLVEETYAPISRRLEEAAGAFRG